VHCETASLCVTEGGRVRSRSAPKLSKGVRDIYRGVDGRRYFRTLSGAQFWLLQFPVRSNAWTQNLRGPDAVRGTRHTTYALLPTARRKPVLAAPIRADPRQIVNEMRASPLSSATTNRSFALCERRPLLGNAPALGRSVS
jgi:hypothetical protein